MLGTADEVQARIRAGEDSFVEFKGLPLGKRSVISPNAEAFAGEMVAFANAEGGAILLGIQDDGTVEGIAESELGTVEQWVVNVATNGCDPPIRPVIRKVLLPGEDGVERAVFVVEVKQSLYVHATTNGRWLVRVGSSKRRLTSQELPRLFQQRGRAYVFDEQPVMTGVARAARPPGALSPGGRAACDTGPTRYDPMHERCRPRCCRPRCLALPEGGPRGVGR